MRFVVVGGGVAGVCCAEELCRVRPQDSVTLVAADRVLKGVSVVVRLSRTLEELALVERRLDELPWPNLQMVQGVAAGIDAEGKELLLGDGRRLPYDKLCICAGARPKQLPPTAFHARPAPGLSEAEAEAERQRQEAELRRRVLTIRDTDSVQRLAARLRGARRVAVVGNGGIALELISGLQGKDVTWIMRHAHIGDAYFDLDAAQFLLEELQQQREQQAQQVAGAQQQQQQEQKQEQLPPSPQEQQQEQGRRQPSDASLANGAGSEDNCGSGKVLGHAVGPRWVQQLLPAAVAAEGGTAEEDSSAVGRVDLEYGCEVACIELIQEGGQPQQQPRQPPGDGDSPSQRGGQPPLLLTLTSGKKVEADLVLLAIGVTPALDWVPPCVERAPDGGLKLNRHMQSSDPAIYAAGDSASCSWAAGESSHWFQMRLWSQARSMGIYAAHCMAGVQEQMGADMAFELFTHVTRFLGRKVVLLGLYNGQRLQHEPASDMATYSRVTEGPERTFVRVLLLRGRVQGVVLIGDTELEETFENLILDQLDVSQYGPALLDPDFELDHVFD